MLHNFRRSKLFENLNSSIIFEVEKKYKVHLTQKLTGLKFKMASLSVKRSIGKSSSSSYPVFELSGGYCMSFFKKHFL